MTTEVNLPYRSSLSIPPAPAAKPKMGPLLNLESQPDVRTPRNSVAFPVNGEADAQHTPRPGEDTRGKRTLSELLKLHAEKGTDVTFSQEEASRIAEVLGQWINSGPSPYEAEDDFFTRSHSQDDSSLTSRRSPMSNGLDSAGRPRGQSESVVSQS
ncbi:hypothetical protein B0H21DRAFT_754101 [Amylocystis lapponica]|nr:hypothetical protein B0H21DRAFT_754101 [Amylocystis lapponica]